MFYIQGQNILKLGIHFIRDRVQKVDILMEYVETYNQIDDIFTKPHAEGQFLRRDLGMLDLNAIYMWKIYRTLLIVFGSYIDFFSISHVQLNYMFVISNHESTRLNEVWLKFSLI